MNTLHRNCGKMYAFRIHYRSYFVCVGLLNCNTEEVVCSSKHWYLPRSPQSITTQMTNTNALTALRTSTACRSYFLWNKGLSQTNKPTE